MRIKVMENDTVILVLRIQHSTYTMKRKLKFVCLTLLHAQPVGSILMKYGMDGMVKNSYLLKRHFYQRMT